MPGAHGAGIQRELTRQWLKQAVNKYISIQEGSKQGAKRDREKGDIHIRSVGREGLQGRGPLS